MARPTKYSETLGDKICAMMAEGTSLNRICKMDGMPGRETVYGWLRKHPEFSDNYALAKEDRADTYADEIVDIADTAEDPQKARLQIDARKWIASKLKSKNYGDKVTNELTGPGGEPILWGVPVKGEE